MLSRSAPVFPLFAGVSLALHVAALGVALHRSAAPSQSFEPSPGAGALVGETLDVEPAPVPVDETEPTAAAPLTGVAAPAAHTPPPPTTGPDPGGRAPSSNGSPSPATPAAPALFGAVGVRYATDLATTFTRGFPQAASADAIWGTVEFGSAGTAEVTLVLDATGHLSSSTIHGSPSPALRRGIERTLALLGTRTFTARGAITKLRVTARVTRDDVHDGLHGDVFALSGGSFTGDLGTAFFALPPSTGPGRRVDVELRMLPALPTP